MKSNELRDQNILHICRGTSMGGVEKVVLQLCKIMNPVVNKIVVCAGAEFDRSALENMNIKFVLIPDLANHSVLNIAKIGKILKKTIRDESITIIHTHHRMAAFYVNIFGLYNGRAFVHTCHGVFSDKKLLTRMAYKNAYIVACGKNVKSNLQKCYDIDGDRIVTITNAVEEYHESIKPDSFIQKLRSNNAFIVGDFGRLSYEKGFDIFIKAAQKVLEHYSNVCFLIVGDGDEREKLEHLVASMHISNNVYFLGYRNDVRNIIKQIDLVVLSSYTEGLPLTPIEAFSVGKTVVATNVGGTNEIIDDHVNGLLVEPGNAELLSEKIIEIISDANKRKLYENNALIKYKKSFSMEMFSRNYISAYSNAINESNR